MSAVSFVLIAQTTALVIVSLLLAYPVVAYARNVAHTRGLLLLSGSFLTLTVTYVASFVYQMHAVSAAFDLLSALFAGAGSWEFAKPFVRSDDREVETPTVRSGSGEDPAGNATGGFESARDD